MKEFVYRFEGFHGTPSRCHIRILNEKGKPIVVMCSQFSDKPGTSVTNMAEEIAFSTRQYLESNNATLATLVTRYLREKTISEILADLICAIKQAKDYLVLMLEWIKCTFDYHHNYKNNKNRIENFIWVEHYAPGVGLYENGSYAVVSFDGDMWGPNWRYGSLAAIVKYTGYSEDFFKSPNESKKSVNH